MYTSPVVSRRYMSPFAPSPDDGTVPPLNQTGADAPDGVRQVPSPDRNCVVPPGGVATAVPSKVKVPATVTSPPTINSPRTAIADAVPPEDPTSVVTKFPTHAGDVAVTTTQYVDAAEAPASVTR